MKSKIRILNVLTGIADGGLEMLVYRIYKGLGREKYDLNICTLTRGEKGFIEDNFRSVCNYVDSLDFVNKNINIKGILTNIFQFFKLYKLIRSGNYDVVHSHDFFAAFITRVAVVLCKITFSKKPKKVFITYHNIYYWLKPIHHFSNRILSNFTSNIICVTKAVKDNSIAKEKIKENKFIVIRNGVNSKEFFPDMLIRKSQRSEIGYNDNDIVICNVGVYSERKGQIYLIKAFNNLLKKYKNIKLALIGSTREYELEIYNEMVNYVNDNNLNEYVKFIGTIKEVNKIYNMLDIFVMCSITEGFGLVAYEAMLAEKICVFSNIPPFLELIKDKENGFIFENKNVTSLEQVLDYVISNLSNLKWMEKVSRKFVEENLSERNMITDYDRIYSS
jgi:glycosyltransferase involved in cell wall biosynthesis